MVYVGPARVLYGIVTMNVHCVSNYAYDYIYILHVIFVSGQRNTFL